DWMVFALEVIPNEELVQQLLTYANRLEVLEPLSLRQELVKRAEGILLRNKV
ncbi:MAG: WYL domain-containing protein, partial [Bacteroidales bacterium]|nr:WYL domain-containing protein [Bacteroidales bacterium]